MYKRVFDDLWNFKKADTKEFTHCYHAYPAMMIPQIARKLLADYSPEGRLKMVFDPYVGSGTTLVESSLKGIKSIGTDLNPLARFISKVKTVHYNLDDVQDGIAQLVTGFLVYRPELVLDTDFDRISNYSFWYSLDILYRLSYINQQILDLKPEIRNFFFLCLSETVREVSFTRNGEFKRYRMSEKQLEVFNPDVFAIFEKKVYRNIKGLDSYNNACTGLSSDIYGFDSTKGIPDSILSNGSVDMVITSPPYGDSHTTVAYGQFSRWANEWFGFENAKNLDNILMGGIVKKNNILDTISIRDDLEAIRQTDEKRYDEVVSFLYDYNQSIGNVANVVRKGGRVCYVVGNRRVKNVQINMDYFTAEAFEKNGFNHDVTIVRQIPNKRMPSKNSPSNISGVKSETMTEEFIVILTKK